VQFGGVRGNVIGRSWGGFVGFAVSRDTRYRGLNGFDGGGDILRGRPGLHASYDDLTQALELAFAGVAFFEKGGERFEIAAAINKFGLYRGDEVARGADAITGDDGEAAAHGFVDNDGEGFVAGGEDHNVRGSVDGGELRLIEEAEEANARGDAELGGVTGETGAKRAVAGDDEQSVGQSGFSESTQKIARTLPRLKLGAEKDYEIFGSGAPGAAHGFAIDFGGALRPPIVVDGIRRERDARFGDAEGHHQFFGVGGGDDDLVSQTKEPRPYQFFDGGFPRLAIAWGEGCAISAEEESGARGFGRKEGDPKRGAEVAGEAKDGVELTFANESPKGGVPDARQMQGGGAAGKVGPGVAIEERNIPLNGGGKIFVWCGFGPAQTAVDDMDVDGIQLSHAAEDGCHVLHGVRSDGQNPQTPVQHDAFRYVAARWRVGSNKSRVKPWLKPGLV
jgi:hypothetical protein